MVRNEGGECLAIAGDVGDEQFCRKAVRQVVDRFGGVEVLVNNAAEQHRDRPAPLRPFRVPALIPSPD
jgi:NAD(P)-dependent dehydrogenase (short-subunit alcohol dehydrogenase family)